ncbi:VOC family protein [Glaciibacter flavus]|uniref:VOC family protein n=1 Tax=Orlajensenia flava TaxID=2565934 RepID=A0A4S4FY73_9MICO|nr:VOC family protein [Glaciibacter flavus]THG34965.1 VOC family protein [Glaciibacter flavus]
MSASDVTLQPMIHVRDLPASVAFYEALGATVIEGSREGDFVLLALGTSQLSLLAHPANPEQGDGEVELNFAAADLDVVVRELEDQVEIVSGPTDTGFGRQLQLRAPGGMLIKVNQLEDIRGA